MTAIEYLKGLIAALEMDTSIPIQLSELKFLLTMLEAKDGKHTETAPINNNDS
jgi:hypothetical protein